MSLSVNYKQALQVAAVAIAYEVLPPTDSTVAIGSMVLGLIGLYGADLAYKVGRRIYAYHELTFRAPELKQDAIRLTNSEEAKEFGNYVSNMEGNSALIQKGCPAKHMVHLDNIGNIFYAFPELAANCFLGLDIGDIGRFGRVNKCSYLATKSQLIWDYQFKKLFPTLERLPGKKYKLSVEQQLKSFYIATYKRSLEPMILQFKKNEQRISELRGPNGFNGEINAAWEVHDSWCNYELPLNCKDSFREKIIDLRYDATTKFLEKRRELVNLVGSNYDGTNESMASFSEQRTLYCSISMTIHLITETNDQQGFETCILTVEKVHDELQKLKKKTAEFEELSQLAKRPIFGSLTSA